MIGSTIGNYRISRQIAEGGMGTVFAADHVGGWPAALKRLRPEFNEEKGLAECYRIANTAMTTGHPGIVGVLETFRHGGRNAFIASELVAGESLAAALDREGRLFFELGAKIAWQIATAVGAAHGVGVSHRVLRPEHVMVFPDPQAPGGYRARVLNYGKYCFFEGGAPNWGFATTARGLGLPLYMAPEQLRGGVTAGDSRSDIYALGCLLFQMSCGRPPFVGQSHQEVAQAHLIQNQPFAQQFEPTVPPDLNALIARMMERQPEARLQTMQEVAFELERISAALSAPSAQSATHSTMQLRAVTPDAEPPPPEPAAEEPRKSRRGLVVAVVGLLAVGAGAGAAFLTRGRLWDKRKVEEARMLPAALPADAAPAPVVHPDAAPPPPRQPSEAEKKVMDAHKAIAEERWADAAAAAKGARKLEAANPEAAKLQAQAEAELAASVVYKDFGKAAARGDVAAAARAYGNLPAASVYLGKAKPDFEKLRDKFVADREAEAKALAAKKQCEAIGGVVKKVAVVFPDLVDGVMRAEKDCYKARSGK